jgi:hypothetical protein
VASSAAYSTSKRLHQTQILFVAGLLINNHSCTSGFDANLVTSANATICAYDGLFGYVGVSTDLIKMCESQASLVPVINTSTALGSMSISDLSRAYLENTLRPVDIARSAAARASNYLRQNPDVGIILKELDVLLHEAETLQRRFVGMPLPPLYGIPFTVDRLEDHAEVDVLIRAGALLIGIIPRSSASVAALSVSFALDSKLSGIAWAGGSTSITVFHPTSIDSRPLTHRDARPTTIVAESSEEARKVWLVIEQDTSHQEDTLVLSQAIINSWVWHVDFCGPKSGGFVFGLLRSSSCCSDASHHLHTAKAIRQLEEAGGKTQEVDWSIFEEAKEVTRDLVLLAAKDNVSMKAVLELQTRHMQLSRQAAKILDTVDVLFDPMTTCLCHSASERAQQDCSLVDSLNLCGISVGPRLTQTEQEYIGTAIMLVGATGRDGRILDIARELEKTMLY